MINSSLDTLGWIQNKIKYFGFDKIHRDSTYISSWKSTMKNVGPLSSKGSRTMGPQSK